MRNPATASLLQQKLRRQAVWKALPMIIMPLAVFGAYGTCQMLVKESREIAGAPLQRAKGVMTWVAVARVATGATEPERTATILVEGRYVSVRLLKQFHAGDR